MSEKISVYRLIKVIIALFLICFLFSGLNSGCFNKSEEQNHSDHEGHEEDTAHEGHEEDTGHEGHEEDSDHEGHEEGPSKFVTVDMEIMKEIGLKIDKIKPVSRPVYIEAIGEVIPNENKLVTITPIVNGKVKAVNVNLGDYVNRDFQLALVASPDLATAIADFQASAQEIGLSGEKLNIKEGFANTGAYSGPPYEGKKQDLARGKSDFVIAKENLKISEAALLAAEKEYKKISAIGETEEFGKRPLEEAKNLYSQAEQDYLQAENNLSRAETELERSENLYKAGLVSKKELLSVQTEYENVKVEAVQTKAQMEVAKGILEREESVYSKGVRSEAEMELAKSDYIQAEKEYNQAKAEFEKAGIELDIIKAQMAREEEIYAQDLNTREEIQEADADYKKALIEYEKSAAVLDAFGISPENAYLYAGGQMPVTSPINGYVLERNVNIGEIVVPETVMFKILDASTLWIDSEIYEKDFTKVKIGQTVEVSTPAYPEKDLSGKIFYISNTFHQETRTFDVRISFDNKGDLLKPGMTVTSKIAVEEASGIILPSGAVLEDNGETVVFVRVPGKDNEFERREVEAVTLDGDVHLITSGLSEGEEVVTEGAFQLRSEANKGILEGGHQH